MDVDKPKDASASDAGKGKPDSEARGDSTPPAGPNPPRCLARLREALPDALEEETFDHGVFVVRVRTERIVDVCGFLKGDPDCRMTLLSNLCGVDMIKLERPEPRFDVVYHLYSIEKNERITLKAAVAEDAEIASVCGVWRTANWHEREAFDMFGIRFSGHPDLTRILMPDEFDAFPLRKDFPLEGREKDHGNWRRPEDERRGTVTR